LTRSLLQPPGICHSFELAWACALAAQHSAARNGVSCDYNAHRRAQGRAWGDEEGCVKVEVVQMGGCAVADDEEH
jgi:hypothetical protein